MSPQKASVSKPGKDDVVKPGRGQGRERKPRISSIKPESLVPTAHVPPPEVEPEVEPAVPVPPKTPAADFFSPTQSEPSASRLDGRDTPPPSGLNSTSSTSSALNGASRPSRRARAAVNYAEPNLISKMRRPTKELADAVALAAHQSAKSAEESQNTKMRSVTIKHEDGTTSHLKDNNRPENLEAGSPLGGKGNGMDDGLFEAREKELADTQPTASGRAIAALMAKGARREARSEEMKVKAEETVEDMKLYDFTDSSPRDVEASGARSRRHSSVSGPSATKRTARRTHSREEERQAEPAETEDMAEAGSRRAERITVRRRSMMV